MNKLYAGYEDFRTKQYSRNNNNKRKGKERETSTYVTTAEHYSADYLQNGELSPYVVKIMYRDCAF